MKNRWVIPLYDKIKENKLRILMGTAVMLLSWIFSFLLVRDSGIKNLLVCLCLGGMIGVSIGCPKIHLHKYWNYVVFAIALVLYGVIVPSRMFVRTQFTTGDMSTLITGVYGLNICLVFFLFFGLLFLTQRTSLALGIEGILLLFVTVVNYYTTAFRGIGLTALDFTAAKTAFMVMGEYTYHISAELWKTILYYVLFILIGFRIDIKVRGIKYHAVITVVAVIGSLISYGCYHYSDAWNTPGIYGETGNIMAGNNAYGLYYYLLLTSKAGGMEKPEGYSKKAITAIAQNADNQYAPSSEYHTSENFPNVIMIMNEAWSDLRVLGNIETNEEVMPFYDSIKTMPNVISGNTYVNIIGGMTSNTEFEALTGNSMAFLHTAAIPYNMQINHKISSIATILGAQGYQTVAMHPYTGISWNRKKVYGYMGFDSFVTIDEMSVEYEKVGAMISDQCNFEEVINLYENRDRSKPFFMFNVTIQNHSPYGGQAPDDISVIRVGNSNADNLYELQQYLNLMKLTDQAFQELIQYFEEIQEPTIICMFGDHQPILSDAFYDRVFEGRDLTETDKKSLMYTTPYVIWTNYGRQMPEYGDLNASHIGAVLCEIAGVELPSYYRFILRSREEVPAFHIFSDVVYQKNTVLDQYRCLQYGQLMEEDYQHDIYEIK